MHWSVKADSFALKSRLTLINIIMNHGRRCSVHFLIYKDQKLVLLFSLDFFDRFTWPYRLICGRWVNSVSHHVPLGVICRTGFTWYRRVKDAWTESTVLSYNLGGTLIENVHWRRCVTIFIWIWIILLLGLQFISYRGLPDHRLLRNLIYVLDKLLTEKHSIRHQELGSILGSEELWVRL